MNCDQAVNDLEGSDTILDDGDETLVFEFDTQYEKNTTNHFATSRTNY